MTILSFGRTVHRTKLLTREQAERFMACVANNPLFTAPALCRSNRTEHPTVCWYAQYEPASPSGRSKHLSAEQSKRLDRAYEEGERYIWVRDPDRPMWLLAGLSGDIYELDLGFHTCSCPDFEVRLGKGRDGLCCKHLCAGRMRLGTFYTLPQFNSPQGQQHWQSIHGARHSSRTAPPAAAPIPR